MEKTVKEIIEKWINHYKEQNMVFNDNFIRFQKILEIIEVAYENELAEKDKKINSIINQITQVKQICGGDFTKWLNNMAHDILKVVYEQLKEMQNDKNS